MRGLSIEPQLEAIDLGRFIDRLDWVICGGESGSRARPFDPRWARALRDCCASAGVAFFMKQLGKKPIGLTVKGKGEDLLSGLLICACANFPSLLSGPHLLTVNLERNQ
jgi:protein gp37